MDETNLAQPYGQVVRRHEDSALIMSESLYQPATIINTHSHNLAYFCFLLRGSYSEKYGNHSRECKRSTVVFHPPNESHSTRFSKEGARLFRFEIKPGLFDRIRDCSSTLHQPAEFDGGLPAQLAAKLYREFGRTDAASGLVIEGLALEMAAYIARRDAGKRIKRRPLWLAQASDFIHQQFHTSLSLVSVAQAAGVHPLHLARVFRQFENCTVGEYIRKVRIDYAAQQLSETTTPLANIALASGFCDQAHFSKTFRCLTGMTPSQYRSNFR